MFLFITVFVLGLDLQDLKCLTELIVLVYLHYVNIWSVLYIYNQSGSRKAISVITGTNVMSHVLVNIPLIFSFRNVMVVQYDLKTWGLMAKQLIAGLTPH